MSLYVRDSEINLIEKMRKSHTEQIGCVKEIHRHIAYRMPYEFYCDMMVYEYWMNISLFPIGFLFKMICPLPNLPEEGPFEFRTVGFVVKSDKSLETITLVVVGGERDSIEGHRT